MIAIIPARGGSKRIPHKNRKLFHGVPIIEIVINNLVSYNAFERIIVSTDDKSIAQIAKSAGAEVPFLRPSKLSDDFSDTVSVVKHAILELNIHDGISVSCIYPTSVFLNKMVLTEVLEISRNNPKNFVFVANKFHHPIQRAFKIEKSNIVKIRELNSIDSRTQDLIPFYFDAGQIYTGYCNTWKSETKIIKDNEIAVYNSENFFMDIDNPEDWAKAEMYYKYLRYF
jgi:pseudaminic acid cytidylyltransferase